MISRAQWLPHLDSNQKPFGYFSRSRLCRSLDAKQRNPHNVKKFFYVRVGGCFVR
jgi:hypothetical protein